MRMSTAVEQVGEAVAQRMQRHRLGDRRVGRLVEQPVELAGGHRPARLAARKQPALRHGRLPTSRVGRAFHHWRNRSSVFLTGPCGPATMIRWALSRVGLQADHLARAQAATIQGPCCRPPRVSSGLITSGIFWGSRTWISAARSGLRSVTRNRNRNPVMVRLRLEMLIPVSPGATGTDGCPAVAVSGEP